MKLALPLAAACLLACAPERRPGLEPRHVLIVTVESLRPERLSCYQHVAPTDVFASTLEERLDGRAFGLAELARTGVVFENACASSSSADVSLAALWTGRSPLETGTLEPGSALAGDERTWARALSEQGFACAAFVSDAGTDLAERVARGFGELVVAPDDEAALAAAQAWFAARDSGDGQSTCVWVHLAGLAPPWDTPLATADAEALLGAEPEHALDGSPAALAALARGELVLDDAARGALLTRYERRLRATLTRLEAFLRATYDWTTSTLEASETWARTLFVFAGVNGLELGEHGPLGPELSPHEEALRVPLVLRHPDSITGERVFAEVVSLEDVAGTVLEAVGLERLDARRSRSLLDLIDREPRGRWSSRAAVSVLPGPVYSLRGVRWRVIWRRWEADAAASWRAFDRVEDPGELFDRSSAEPGVIEWARREQALWRFDRHPPGRAP